MKLDIKEEKTRLRVEKEGVVRSQHMAIKGAVIKKHYRSERLHRLSSFSHDKNQMPTKKRFRIQKEINRKHYMVNLDKVSQKNLFPTKPFNADIVKQKPRIGSYSNDKSSRRRFTTSGHRMLKTIKRGEKNMVKKTPYVGSFLSATEGLRKSAGGMTSVLQADRSGLRTKKERLESAATNQNHTGESKKIDRPEKTAAQVIKWHLDRIRNATVVALSVLFPPLPLIIAALTLVMVLLITGAVGAGLLGERASKQVMDDIASKGNVRIERQLLEDDYTFPLPRGYSQISSGFDSTRRFAPADYILGGHVGVDFPVPIGTPVYAFKSGTVVEADVYSDGAIVVAISHPKGDVSRYIHLSKMLVTRGQNVKVGDLIALSGNTGQSSGPHLHFQYETNGSAGWAKSAVDPRPMFKQNEAGEWLSLKEYARLSGNSTETKKEIQ